jgi:hypothetical protein
MDTPKLGHELRHGFDFSEFGQNQGVSAGQDGILTKDKPADSGRIPANP